MLIPPRAAQVISSPGTRSDMDWRKIEQALIEIARAEKHEVDEEASSGDKYIYVTENTVNASELAKQLAERLA